MQAPIGITVDLSAVEARFDKLDGAMAALTTTIINQGARMDADLQKVNDDLDAIKQQTGDYIAARDAIDVAKDAKIADLTAQLSAKAAQGVLDAATIADFHAGVTAALAKAEADKALLAPAAPPAPPAVLDASFSDATTFQAAVATYQSAGGTNGVSLDGSPVGDATLTPVVAYFTQTDGSVSTTPLPVVP